MWSRFLIPTYFKLNGGKANCASVYVCTGWGYTSKSTFFHSCRTIPCAEPVLVEIIDNCSRTQHRAPCKIRIYDLAIRWLTFYQLSLRCSRACACCCFCDKQQNHWSAPLFLHMQKRRVFNYNNQRYFEITYSRTMAMVLVYHFQQPKPYVDGLWFKPRLGGGQLFYWTTEASSFIKESTLSLGTVELPQTTANL